MRNLRRGLLAALPVAPGIVAFGLLYGMMARQVGLSPWEAVGMSTVVYAGSAQLTALGIWGTAGAAAILALAVMRTIRKESG